LTLPSLEKEEEAFWKQPTDGSIGVFTINLPRIGYLSKSESEFKERLWKIANIGKTSLEIKRKIIEQQSERDFIRIQPIT